ncbi:uncharacterized protein LOC123505530 [Portunus trituberculatus]|uniref:uncharacterized protein LOC123505530 n=1 Tax=Portunus trituberculatus TaxID=210409 RepID=UPI001E1CB98D|nr:uncharacterized protein LOC123505530 [Portunus trituberculatus]XP_045112868.1 uncharacterized protein LOC123505530 [Portunus trituberculatus]XP_045112869.1 uncharacterized protein LOC123505530 [Portunus trituberculatus]
MGGWGVGRVLKGGDETDTGPRELSTMGTIGVSRGGSLSVDCFIVLQDVEAAFRTLEGRRSNDGCRDSRYADNLSERHRNLRWVVVPRSPQIPCGTVPEMVYIGFTLPCFTICVAAKAAVTIVTATPVAAVGDRKNATPVYQILGS